MKKDAMEIVKAKKNYPFVRGTICTILEAQKKKAFKENINLVFRTNMESNAAVTLQFEDLAVTNYVFLKDVCIC